MTPVSFLSQISFFICFLTFGCGFHTKPTTNLGLYLSNHGDLRLQMRTLLIDNFDSYTYNIWQLLSEVNGEEPIVVYNNAFNYNWDELLLNVPKFDNIVISPGPGSPIALNLQDIQFKIDANNDFDIDQSEALQVSYLFVSGSNISNVTGIEYFTNLQYLFVHLNMLSTLDCCLAEQFSI